MESRAAKQLRLQRLNVLRRAGGREIVARRQKAAGRSWGLCWGKIQNMFLVLFLSDSDSNRAPRQNLARLKTVDDGDDEEARLREGGARCNFGSGKGMWLAPNLFKCILYALLKGINGDKASSTLSSAGFTRDHSSLHKLIIALTIVIVGGFGAATDTNPIIYGQMMTSQVWSVNVSVFWRCLNIGNCFVLATGWARLQW
jgi:hypothetical protein